VGVVCLRSVICYRRKSHCSEPPRSTVQIIFGITPPKPACPCYGLPKFARRGYRYVCMDFSITGERAIALSRHVRRCRSSLVLLHRSMPVGASRPDVYGFQYYRRKSHCSEPSCSTVQIIFGITPPKHACRGVPTTTVVGMLRNRVPRRNRSCGILCFPLRHIHA